MKNYFVIKAAAAATALALLLCGCFSRNTVYSLNTQHEGTAPSITSQPSDVRTRDGENVSFEVAAEGDGLTYQWYYKKYDFPSWRVWKGHDTAITFATANETWNGMRVYCSVRDRNGFSTATRAALITIENPPEILLQPRSVTVDLGEKAYFRVHASGKGALTYQWYYKKSNSPFWTKWRGHTLSETEAVSNNSWNGMQVFCIVTDSTGGSVSSQSASVTVREFSDAASHPEGRNLLTYDSEMDATGSVVSLSPQCVAAKTGEIMRFSVSAPGIGLRYQWYLKQRNMTMWIPLKGHSEENIFLKALPEFSGGEILCVITDSFGRRIASQPAAITVNDKINITRQPKDTTFDSGEQITIPAATEAIDARFQWYGDKGDGFGWKKLAGQQSRKLSAVADSSWNGMKVRCMITADGCPPVFSQTAVITVDSELKMKSSPKNITARSGDNVTFSVKATGRDLSYQWMRKSNGSEVWECWQGYDGASARLPADRSWHRMKVRCDISDCTGKMISSDAADVWITDALDILRQPRSITVKAYEPAEFSVSAQGKGLKYQWYFRKKGSNHWNLWKKHNTSFTSALSNPSWDGMNVMCVITDAYGDTMRSKSSVVRIIE